MYEVEGLYYLCSENKGADQLRGSREADLHLFFSHMQNVGFHITQLNYHAIRVCIISCFLQIDKSLNKASCVKHSLSDSNL